MSHHPVDAVMRDLQALRIVRNAASLPYPEFVALTGQDNAPPGGSVTYDYWLSRVALGEEGRCLDMACSTGLSARTLARRTGCRACGIDLSRDAIRVARQRASREGLADRLRFVTGDASALPFASTSFDAVVVGSSFGFISARQQALSEAARVLVPEGALLVACRHYVDTPPTGLLDAVEAAIGYRPDPLRDYAWWQAFFRRHFTRSEELQLVIPETDPKWAVKSLARAAEEPDHPLSRLSAQDRAACLDRLHRIREILCVHDRYQGLSLMVWRR